jgi:photosystem II stability/assembly factor-like uncharacterized protein
MKIYSYNLILLIAFLSNSLFAQWILLPQGGTSIYPAGNKLYGCPGVSVSTDYGSTWTGLGLDSCEIKMVVQNGNKLYAGSGWYGVYLSTNEGQSWTNVAFGIPVVYWTINTLCAYGSNIFAGTHGGIYHSTNDGTNWTAVNTGLNNYDVHSIILKDNILFAGTAGGVYISTDNGQSWSVSINNIGSVNKLAASGVNIYCGTNSGGVLLSTNDGASWSYINIGLPNYDVTSLAVSGSDLFEGQFRENGVIFKVYYSSDNGQNWIDVTGGINGAHMNNLSISGDYIFASTIVGWRRSISEILGVRQINEKVPSNYTLYQNYPNPFNPSTRIKIDIPAGISGKVNLVVYNELGKEVATLIGGEYKPGTYEVEWNASNYPSGVYFYKLVTNGFTDSKKMVLIK